MSTPEQALRRLFPILVVLVLSVGVVSTAHADCQNSENIESCSISGLDLRDGNVDTDDGIYVLNIEDCREAVGDDDELTFQFTTTFTPDSDSNYSFKLKRPDDSACDTDVFGDENSDDCEIITNSADLDSSSVDLDRSITNVLGFSDVETCSTTTSSQSYFLYFIFSDNSGTDGEDDVDSAQLELRLDRSRPSAPTIESAEAGETQIEVDWEGDEDNDFEYRIYYSTTEFSGGVAPETLSGVSSGTEISSSSGTVSPSDMEVGDLFYVAVVAINDSGNESLLSSVLEVTAQETDDFWESYVKAGGTETGGCATAASASPSVWMGLSLLGLIGLRRRDA